MTHRPDKPADQVMDPAVLDRLLEAVAPETPPAGLRAKVLERARTAATLTAHTLRAGEGAWKPVLPGIEVKTLFYDAPARMVSFLLRAQAGASLPAHGHRTCEECLVLEGEFTMGDLTLHAGDFVTGHPGEAHPPATTRTGVLVYLRGAVDDYPFACR
jgi:anti-sigma factor ChrR (cupin superfamily)